MVIREDTEDPVSSMAKQQNIQPTYGYYRQPNGWITVSPITTFERVKYIGEGWTHLNQYGAFDVSPYVINHPFEALFMFGGVQEMCADQVIRTGLYLDPPLVPTCRQQLTQYHRGHNPACWLGAKRVQFPQLANVDTSELGPFPCAFCERQMATIEAREQHQSVAHKEALGSLQTGRSLGVSLAEALNKNGAVPGGVAIGQASSQEAMLQEISELKQAVAELTRAQSRPRRQKTTSKA